MEFKRVLFYIKCPKCKESLMPVYTGRVKTQALLMGDYAGCSNCQKVYVINNLIKEVSE